MFEFLIATGKVGVFGLFLVFVVVFSLAEPGKEISFWGIKFHKKYRFIDVSKWKRVPRRLPSEWQIILQAFSNMNVHQVHELTLFEEVRRLNNLSELKARAIIAEMKEYNLLRHSMNYVSLKEKALPLVDKLKGNE